MPRTAAWAWAPMCLRMCAGRVRKPEAAAARRRGLRGAQAAVLVPDPLARRRLRRVRLSGMQAGARRGLRRAAAAAAVLPPVPLPRRLRRRVRPPGRRRRGASHRASGVGRAAGTLALAPPLPLRGRRSRRRARAGSAVGLRQFRALRATVTTTSMPTLSRALATRPRTRRLLEWSRARGRRLRTLRSGVALRRTRSIQRNVGLVLGGTAWVRSALACRSWDATCSARFISISKGNEVGTGAWTGSSRRKS